MVQQTSALPHLRLEALRVAVTLKASAIAFLLPNLPAHVAAGLSALLFKYRQHSIA